MPVDKDQVIFWLTNNRYTRSGLKNNFPELYNSFGTSIHTEIRQKLYNWINDITEHPICKNTTCFNPTKYWGLTIGYSIFCSKKCTFSDKEIYDRRFPKKSKEEKDLIKSKKIHTITLQTKEEKVIIKQNRINGHLKRSSIKEEERRNKISIFWKNLPIEDLRKIKYKTKVTKLPNIIDILKNRIKNDVDVLFSWDDFGGVDNNFKYKFLCKKCFTEFISDLDDGKIPRCLQCCPYTSNRSVGEIELYDYICSLVGIDQVFANSRVLGKEIDVYVPSKNIGFEYNGSYWHNEELKGQNYHIDKLKLANDKGISLIQIMDFEWRDKNSAVKNRIMHLLGLSKRLYARKCIIKNINFIDCRDFMNDNHIQGSISSFVYLGLYFEDELVSVMTFGKPRFNKNFQWELIRFCSKYNVVGAASKLFKNFIKNYDPIDIISYADRRYSNNGGLYYKLGFVLLDKDIRPGYFYVDKDLKKVSRYTVRYNLKKYNITEKELVVELKLWKIWDCGQLVFLWKKHLTIK